MVGERDDNPPEQRRCCALRRRGQRAKSKPMTDQNRIDQTLQRLYRLRRRTNVTVTALLTALLTVSLAYWKQAHVLKVSRGMNSAQSRLLSRYRAALAADADNVGLVIMTDSDGRETPVRFEYKRFDFTGYKRGAISVP